MVLINKGHPEHFNLVPNQKNADKTYREDKTNLLWARHTYRAIKRNPKEKTKKIVYAGASFLLLNGTGYQTGRVRDKDRLVSFVMWAQPQKEFKLAFIWVLTKLCERYHKR